MVEVDSLLDGTGIDWTIQSVTAINDAGALIGTGLFQGQFRTFLMTPVRQ